MLDPPTTSQPHPGLQEEKRSLEVVTTHLDKATADLTHTTDSPASSKNQGGLPRNILQFHDSLPRQRRVLPLLRELSAGLAKHRSAYDSAKTTKIFTMPVPTGQLTISSDFGIQHAHNHLSWQRQPFAGCGASELRSKQCPGLS